MLLNLHCYQQQFLKKKKKFAYTNYSHCFIFPLSVHKKKVFQVVITLHLVSERVILKEEHCFTNWTHTLFAFL